MNRIDERSRLSPRPQAFEEGEFNVRRRRRDLKQGPAGRFRVRMEGGWVCGVWGKRTLLGEVNCRIEFEWSIRTDSKADVEVEGYRRRSVGSR